MGGDKARSYVHGEFDPLLAAHLKGLHRIASAQYHEWSVAANP